MSENTSIVIRNDLENIISNPSDQYENNLQQELDELILVENESEEDEDDADLLPHSIDEDDDDDNDEDIIAMNDETSVFCDRNYISVDNLSSGKLTLYLTEEEQDIINNCKDPKLKQLLLINRTKAVHIKEMCKKLRKLFDELSINIRKEKEKYRQEEKNMKEHPELQSMARTHIWRIGIPFFKDKSFYSAPPNKDLAKKKENKEFFSAKIVEGRKWTEEDQQILRDSVVASYFSYNLNKLEQDIRLARTRLKFATDETEKLENSVKIENLQRKLKEINADKNEPPPINCLEGIDWYKISNFDLKSRHTHLECKAFWNIYLHPSINKTDWLPEENEKIKELAVTYSCDWDLIAKELNTNRSPYLICVHYNTKLCDKFKRQRFLPEEDEFLMEVVENCRLGDYIPWGRVAYYFEDRSKHQLYHRYKYYVGCKNIRKGTFTEAEDVLLCYLTEKFGKDFSRISELMPQRTSIQLRNRYTSYLQKLNIQLGNFTRADDERILNHVAAHGHKNWSILSKHMNRTRAHVRQRYLTLKKLMEKNPDLTIDSLPRRKQAFLSSCQVKKNARMVTYLEKLREVQGIPTLATVEKFVNQVDKNIAKKEKGLTVTKTQTKKKSRSYIDEKIVEFFKGTCKFQRKTTAINEVTVMESAKRIIKIFEALGANVNVFKEVNIEDNSLLLSEADEEIIKAIKTILEKNSTAKGRNSFIIETASSNPGPSHLDPLSIDLPKNPVKHLLPPNVNTLLGLRGMIIKYQVYKSTHKNFGIKMETSSKLVDPMIWKLEHNLVQHDIYTRMKIEHERDIFYKRFCSILKWPCILSGNFPEHLIKVPEEENPENDEDEKVVIEEQQEKRKVGRPTKKVYAKVLKMVEAKKRKRVVENIDNDDDNNKNIETTTTAISSNDDETNENQSKKLKRGRPMMKLKSEHAVAYIPRRSHVKMINKTAEVSGQQEEEEEEIVDLEKNKSSPSIEPSTSSSSAPPRIINVKDLKIINSKSIIVNKEEINKLMKLNKLTKTNKFIVLQGTNQFLTKTTKPTQQQLEKKETTPRKAKYQNIDLTAENEDPLIKKKNNNKDAICMNNDNWGGYCEKWKNINLSKKEKETLEQDLNKICSKTVFEEKNNATTEEKEEVLQEENVQALQEEYEENNQMMDIKMESIWMGSDDDEETDNNLTEELSIELYPFKNFKEVMNNEHNSSQKIKAVIESKIENNSHKLSASIDKIRNKMKLKNTN